MKSRDFDLILIESLSHETKQSFFAENRELFKCNPDEYSKGLLDSYTRLNNETHETDFTRCIITKKNGDEVFGTIRNADDDYLFGKIGKVTYPYKKIIRVDVPELCFRLTAEMMEKLWPELQLYLQSVIDGIRNCHPNIQRSEDESLISNNVPLHNGGKKIINDSNQDKRTEYTAKLKALSKYITEINVDTFINIIENHALTPGTLKASWIGRPADAHRFATYLKIKLPDWNKCFSMDGGRILKHNDKNDTFSIISDILKTNFTN